MITKLDRQGKVSNFPILLVVIVILLSLLFGLLTATGNVLIGGLLIVFMIGGMLIFSPSKLILLAAVSSLIIVGTLESFFSLPQANWLASMLVAALAFSILTSKVVSVRLISSCIGGTQLMIFGLIVYVATLLASSLINRISLSQFVVGFRAYFPFIGLFLVIYFGRLSARTLWQIVQILIFAGCMQGVYCLVEKFLVAPSITSSIFQDYEMMIGSFGGSFYTGGYTGEMATFVCMNLILCFVLTQENIFPRWTIWPAALSAAISVGLAETKIIFFILPMMMLVLFWKYPGGVNRKILKGLGLLVLALALIGGIYSQRFWQGTENVGRAFFYTFDPNFMVSPGHRGRIASIMYWADEVLVHGPFAQTLVGHGPASSIGGTLGSGSSIAGIGSAVRIYGAGLDSSAITKLLWDVGLIGTFGFIAIMLGALFQATKSSLEAKVCAKWRWLMVVLKAWVIAFIIMLPYQPAMLGGVPVQFLFWLTMGLIAYASKWQTNQTTTSTIPKLSVSGEI